MNSLRSPLVRWHIRHVVMLWIGARILVSMALAWAASMNDGPSVPLSDTIGGGSAAFATLLLTLALVIVDRRRIGAPLYFANLGYTWQWQLSTAAALCVVAEVVCVAALRALLSMSS